jgi:hypothetical protein
LIAEVAPCDPRILGRNSGCDAARQVGPLQLCRRRHDESAKAELEIQRFQHIGVGFPQDVGAGYPEIRCTSLDIHRDVARSHREEFDTGNAGWNEKSTPRIRVKRDASLAEAIDRSVVKPALG